MTIAPNIATAPRQPNRGGVSVKGACGFMLKGGFVLYGYLLNQI